MDTPLPRPPGLRAPHIAEAVAPRSRPGRLRRVRPLPIPVPVSTFAPSTPPPAQTRRWEPRCNHSHMTRLYHADYKCEVCRRTGHFGWVYRCTVDREALILGAKQRDERVSFDFLGQTFEAQMTLGKYGPDARADKYSFLREITNEQLRTYTPDQLVTILLQRDNVRATIKAERQFTGYSATNNPGKKYPDDARPWIPDALYECQYKVCHDCYRLGIDKSWISMNAVLSGDVLPSLATGFGFSHQGFRPTADMELVKELGCHAVPLPYPYPLGNLTHQRSGSSMWRLMDVIDEHLESAAPTDSTDSLSSSESTSSDESDDTHAYRGHLPQTIPVQPIFDPEDETHQPNVEGIIDVNGNSPTDSIFEAELLIRPPWTPPPTPELGYESVYAHEPTPVDFAQEPPSYNGRSPASLKTNQTLRNRVFASVPSPGKSHKQRLHRGHTCQNAFPYHPYKSEEMCDVGLFLPFNPDVYERACETPLPSPTLDESLYFVRCNTITEGSEGEEASLSDEACDIADAVAMTEEALESGTADVVAHVGQLRFQPDM